MIHKTTEYKEPYSLFHFLFIFGHQYVEIISDESLNIYSHQVGGVKDDSH